MNAKSHTLLFRHFLGFVSLFVIASSASLGLASEPKKVFAHYMATVKTYDSASKAGYLRDIQDARNEDENGEAGIGAIDGFAVNCPAPNGSQWEQHIHNLWEAADEHGSFDLFLSLDMASDWDSDPDSTDTVEMRANLVSFIREFISYSSYLKYNGKYVVSTFAGNPKSDDPNEVSDYRQMWEGVKSDLAATGDEIFFVPHFYLDGDLVVEADYQSVSDNYERWWKYVVDGMFYFSAGGYRALKENPWTEAYADVMIDNGKLFMAPVNAQYWGDGQVGNNRPYYRNYGGEGLAEQWEYIINLSPAQGIPMWVELVTWNDYNEMSYFSPITIEDHWPWLRHHTDTWTPCGILDGNHPNDFYKSKFGYYKLNQHYVEWFKTGSEPSYDHDKLYYFYRRHSAFEDLDSPSKCDDENSAPDSGWGAMPNREDDPNVKDIVFVSVYAAAAAEVKLSIDGISQGTQTLSPGMNHVRFDFPQGYPLGQPTFEVVRNGATVISVSDEPIVEPTSSGEDPLAPGKPFIYNFSQITGYEKGEPVLDPPYSFTFQDENGNETLDNAGSAGGAAMSVSGTGGTHSSFTTDTATGDGHARDFPLDTDFAPRLKVPDSEARARKSGDEESISVTAWIKWTGNETFQKGLVNTRTADHQSGWSVGIRNGYLVLEAGTFPRRTSVTPVPVNEWVHVAVIWESKDSGGDVWFYIDGADAGVQESPQLAENAPLSNVEITIGSLDETYHSFQGIMDNVRVYERVLAPSEIEAEAALSPAPAYQLLFQDSQGDATLDNTGTAGGTANSVAGTGGTHSTFNTETPSAAGYSREFPLDTDFAPRLKLPNSESDARKNNSDEAISVTSWIKWTGSENNQKGLVNTRTENHQEGWSFGIRNGYLVLEAGLFPRRTSATPVPTNQWVHVAVVWDSKDNGGDVSFYIDGVDAGVQESSQLAENAPLSNTELTIGSLDTTYHSFQGLMDDVRVYERVLTPSEVADQAQ